MDGAFGEPEVMPVQTKAVVLEADLFTSASRAAMSRSEWIVSEQRPVARAASPGAGQQCRFHGNVVTAVDERLQLASQSLREWRQCAPRDATPCVELGGGNEQGHRADAMRGAIVHPCTPTSSPRRSIVTPATRRETPCTPRE